MFSQFRVRYPTGSLISALMTIHQGQYIVHAQVVVEGVVLSTGLAAAETVEEAEDRAKNRALAGLELGQTAVSSASFSSDQSTLSPPSTFSSDLSTTAKPSVATPAPSPTVSQPNSEEEDWLSDDSQTEAWKPPSPPHSVNVPVSPPILTQSSASTPTSVGGYRDLSDEVAKMKVEISRLHWTPEQGKQHLMSIYNKSSSKDLTDEEFFDFLHYLESQPTPTGKNREG